MYRIMTSLCLLACAPSLLADVANGKKLHDQQCMKCHDTGVYTRPDHFITSRAALRKQVERCHINTGAQWFDTDTDDVVEYLDKSFYRFK